MLFQCRATVFDAGPTLTLQWGANSTKLNYSSQRPKGYNQFKCLLRPQLSRICPGIGGEEGTPSASRYHLVPPHTYLIMGYYT